MSLYFLRPLRTLGVDRNPRINVFAGLITVLSMLSACATGNSPKEDLVVAVEEVRSTELSFAKAMADRDMDAFVSRLSRDAIFFDDSKMHRGATEVAAAWSAFFRGPQAPFSWAPDHVEVLGSGDLALSTGPVTVNNRVVARFNSIWRLEAPHTWRIVFDKGEPTCTDSSKE